MKRANSELAAWRAGRSRDEEARFEPDMQLVLHDVVVEMAKEKEVRLHACSTCPTHVHCVVSFRSPACTCGAWARFCAGDCVAKLRAEEVMVRMKRKMGQGLAKLREIRGRKWFSRGWDITPVKGRAHLDYLLTEYLPKHETEQAGIFRRY